MKVRSMILCLFLTLPLCACSSETTATPAPPEFIPRQVQPMNIIVPSRTFQREGEWPQDTTQAVNRLFSELGGPSVTLRIWDGNIWFDDYSKTRGGGFIRAIEGLSSEDTDIFIDEYGARTQELIERGLVQDFSPNMLMHPELYALLPQRAWEETAIDEGLYCIPLIRDFWGQNEGMYGFDIREGVIELLGTPAFDAPEDLVAALRQAKEMGLPGYKLLVDVSAPPYPLHPTYPEWPFMVDEQSRFVLHGDGRVEPYVSSAIFERDRAFLSQLMQEDLLAAVKPDQVTSLVSNVMVSFYPLRRSNVSFVSRLSERQVLWLLSLHPDTAAFASAGPYARMGQVADYAIYIHASCEDVDTALSVIEWLYAQPEIRNELFYNMSTDSRTVTNHIPNATGDAWSTVWEESIPYLQGVFRHQFDEAPYEKVSPPECAVAFAGSGFAFDDAQGASWGVPWQEIDFSDAYLVRMGVLPYVNLPQVLEELDRQGYQEMLEAYRGQYAGYLERFE